MKIASVIDPVQPYPGSVSWAEARARAVKRHTGVAIARRAGARYVHLVRGVWLQWNRTRDAATLVAGWQCSADGSFRVDILPEGTLPTCPVCKVIVQAHEMGHVVGRRSVYFAEKDGLIKIGSSMNVGVRVSSLKARLMAVDATLFPEKTVIPERAAHFRFAHLRDHGEWFRPGPDLLEHIAGLRAAS